MKIQPRIFGKDERKLVRMLLKRLVKVMLYVDILNNSNSIFLHNNPDPIYDE